MTDILHAQAEIKSRRSLTRDTSGQFTRPSAALLIKVAATRMRERLEIDVPAMEHAEGRTRVHGHWRDITNTDRLASPVTATVLPLFNRRAA